MSSLDNDLKMILKIRKMRVDSLNRVQRKHQQERDLAGQAVDSRQQGLKDTEVQVRELEAQKLSELTSGHFVKIDRVESFSKLQLKGVKQIMDAHREIELAQRDFEAAKEVLEESVKATRQAEKKFISIEEAVREISSK